MLRILRRTPTIHALETSGLVTLFPLASIIGHQLENSSAFVNSASNGSVRLYSSLSGIRHAHSGVWNGGGKGYGVGLGNPLEKSLLLSGFSRLILEHSRSKTRGGYFMKEGRPGWRRRRNKEFLSREAVLHPSSPVIDMKFPWPKNDFESLPSELFNEEREELSQAEIIDKQNAVVKSINSQISSRSEGRLFAIVLLNGKQFKVTPEDIIIVQDYFAPTVGDQIRLNKILLVGGKDFTLLGCPLLDDGFARIEATIIEKTLSYTKIHFKFKKRENYRRLKFCKTPYTMLRINMIELLQPLNMVKSDSVTADHQSSVL